MHGPLHSRSTNKGDESVTDLGFTGKIKPAETTGNAPKSIDELMRRRFAATDGGPGADRRVLRQEHKYLMSLSEYKSTAGALSKCLTEDPHNGADGYMVRSLYFDTLQNDDFEEKADGLELRRKIRLRVYDPSADFAFLEMKQKQGAYQLKRSVKLNRDDARAVARGSYSPLLGYHSAFATECYVLMNMKLYRPKAIVQYDRKAFIARENDIRITFDHSITATESCFDIFSESLCLTPVMDPYGVIMEVKYNGFLLTYIKDLLQRSDRSPISAGKYYMARCITQ